MTRSIESWLPLLVLFWLLGIAPAVGSQEPAPAIAEVQIDEEAEGEPEAEINPCDLPRDGTANWLDRLHEHLFESICGSSRWFDGFFGEERSNEVFERMHGRASLDVLWDEYDGWDTRFRLRVKWPLPNLDQRASAFFGREDEDVLTDRDRGLDLIPGPFRDTSEEDWLIGLGYHPQRRNRAGDFDFKVGAKLHFPIDLFVKGRYWRRWFIGEVALFRFTQTLFWRTEQKLGTTTNLEYERFLGQRLLLRWRAAGTVAEREVEGWEWSSALTIFHGLTANDALSYQVIVRGESKDPETLEEYGFSVTYRRRAFREWFFWQVVGGFTWPREELIEEREAAPHVGFGFEIEFDHDPNS